MRSVQRLVILISLSLAATAAQAANTTARLILSHDTARPGETVWAGLHLRMAPKWNTYWQNGGDAGGPTKIEWILPTGITAGEVQWPVPERKDTAGLITYVYHNDVVLVVPLSVAPGASAGALDLRAKVSWLECAQECVQARGQVAAKLSVGAESKPSPDAALLETWRKKLPESKPASFARAGWEREADGDKRPLLIEWQPSQPAKEFDFYPYSSTSAVVQTATEVVSTEAGRVRLRKMAERLAPNWPSEIAGLLIEKGADEKLLAAHQIKLAVKGSSTPGPTNQIGGEKKSIWFWLGYAFLGGLILNIMPCVLPVIALKILGFVSQSREHPRRVRALGILYTLGVVASFLVLAGIVIGVKAAGQKAGWGMQFGNPQFVIALTVVVTLVALNLFGIFEVTLGGRALDAASEAASRHGRGGAFMNGVLATVLATPCTAPFLGAALGFAFAQPAPVIVLFFVTVALGLALPYLLLSWKPQWLKFLPKPGAWMERFKVAMGFPMLATAVWLFSLTTTFYGERSWWLGVFLVFVGAAAWTFGTFVQRGQKHQGLGILVVLALLGTGYAWALEAQLSWRSPNADTENPPSLAHAPSGYPWRPWSPEAIAKARADGHPVVVDFTAKWCLTCNVSVKPAFESKAVIEKLKAINAVTLVADYTRYPPQVSQEIERFGRSGVPLVLVYPADTNKAPIVLSEPLPYPAPYGPTILDALDKAGK
jgi:thiol:disulfide interchange protein DsbD